MKSYPTLLPRVFLFSFDFFFFLTRAASHLFEVFVLICFRLQDGVPDTIAALRDAGIKVGANFNIIPYTVQLTKPEIVLRESVHNIDWHKSWE